MLTGRFVPGGAFSIGLANLSPSGTNREQPRDGRPYAPVQILIDNKGIIAYMKG